MKYNTIELAELLDLAKKEDQESKDLDVNEWLKDKVGIDNSEDGFYWNGKSKDEISSAKKIYLDLEDAEVRKIYDYIKRIDKSILKERKVGWYSDFKLSYKLYDLTCKTHLYVDMLDEARAKDSNASKDQNIWLKDSVGISSNSKGFYYVSEKMDRDKHMKADVETLYKIYLYIKKVDFNILKVKDIDDFSSFKHYAFVYDPEPLPISMKPYIISLIFIFVLMSILIIKQDSNKSMALVFFPSSFVILFILIWNSILVLKKVKKEDERVNKKGI